MNSACRAEGAVFRTGAVSLSGSGASVESQGRTRAEVSLGGRPGELLGYEFAVSGVGHDEKSQQISGRKGRAAL
jgi:hypothetical protein